MTNANALLLFHFNLLSDWNIRKQELNTSVLLPHSDIDAGKDDEGVLDFYN